MKDTQENITNQARLALLYHSRGRPFSSLSFRLSKLGPKQHHCPLTQTDGDSVAPIIPKFANHEIETTSPKGGELLTSGCLGKCENKCLGKAMAIAESVAACPLARSNDIAPSTGLLDV